MNRTRNVLNFIQKITFHMFDEEETINLNVQNTHSKIQTYLESRCIYRRWYLHANNRIFSTPCMFVHNNKQETVANHMLCCCLY